MTEPVIDIYWDPATGEMKIEVEGAGQDCLDLTRALEKLLGMQAGDRKVKPDPAS